MQTVHADFQNEKTLADKYITDKGHWCLFLPKFHCELNPIEWVWEGALMGSHKFHAAWCAIYC